jgi:hypothetical protein
MLGPTMGDMLQKIRLKWFQATRSLRFAEDFTEILYRIYVNHSK